METQANELGAVAVGGQVKYVLFEHDHSYVKLRNVLEADQYVLIDLEALTALASVLKKAAMKREVY